MATLLRCSFLLVFCALFLITLVYPEQVEDVFIFQYDEFKEFTKTCCPFLKLGDNPFKGVSRYLALGVSVFFLIFCWALIINCKFINRLLMCLGMIVGFLLFIPFSKNAFNKNIEKLGLFFGLSGSFMILDGHREVECEC